jgi:hypothetical protein
VLCAVPSGLASNLSLPGTHVPGYRLFRPCGTALLRPVNDTAIAGSSSLNETLKEPSGAEARYFLNCLWPD